MLIVTSPMRIHLSSALRIANKGAIGSIIASVLAFGISWLVDKTENAGDGDMSSSYHSFEVTTNYDSIGSGVLSLTPRRNSSLIPDLSRDIVFLAKSSRPDMNLKDGSFLIKTRGGADSVVVAPGEQVFLECNIGKNGENSYSFTNRRTPLWIRPLAAGRGDLNLEVGLFMPSKQNEGFVEEIGQVNLPQLRSLVSDANEPSYLTSVRGMRWWGNDMLFREYGGIEYSILAQKQKIEIKSESGSFFYFLHPGEYIEWVDGAWRETSLEKSNPSLPLAKIKSLSGRYIEVEVWDENGFYPQILKTELQSPVKNGVKNDLAGCTARLRSSSQITCMLGKRRLIIKEGDWILKAGKSWKILRRSKDIDDCINHKILGELFIFDCLEKQQGKLFIKGRLFDEMRTTVQPILIPVFSETTNTTNTKKNTLLPMIQKRHKTDVRNAQ